MILRSLMRNSIGNRSPYGNELPWVFRYLNIKFSWNQFCNICNSLQLFNRICLTLNYYRSIIGNKSEWTTNIHSMGPKYIIVEPKFYLNIARRDIPSPSLSFSRTPCCWFFYWKRFIVITIRCFWKVAKNI